MRDGPRTAIGGLAAVLIAWAGVSQARGQTFYPPQPAPAGYNDGTAASEKNGVIDELRRRIDANEAELRALRAQQQQAGVAATPTAFDATKADTTVNADAANPFCTPKEVPIIDKPTYRVGVQAFFDNVSIDQSQRNINATGNPKELDYTGLSFLRLYVEGWVYENIDYKFEIEFGANEIVPALGTPTVQNPPGPNAAGGAWTKTQIVEGIQLKDIYSTIRYLPIVGNIRVGHFKEPFMLEELTGDPNLEFERRALPDSFAPARKWGAMAFNYVNENKDLSWYMGTFRDTFSDSSFIERSNEGDWDFCARTVWLPYYDEPSDGRYLLHVGSDFRIVGAGGSLTNPIDQKSFSATEEALSLNPFVNTGSVNCQSYEEYNGELAMINGPLSVSGEATWVTLNDVSTVTGATTGRSATYKGAYVQASYFLTGESRGYDREGKRFAAVKPYEPFFRVRTCDGVCVGKGAWELVARVSYIDLNSVVGPGSGAQPAPINGGELTDYTLGVNWYLNQYTKVWFDWVHCDLNRNHQADAFADIYEMRFSYAF